MLIRFTSFGKIKAPEPTRMASRRIWSLRIRCGRETMIAECSR